VNLSIGVASGKDEDMTYDSVGGALPKRAPRVPTDYAIKLFRGRDKEECVAKYNAWCAAEGESIDVHTDSFTWAEDSRSDNVLSARHTLTVCYDRVQSEFRPSGSGPRH
jgi:hypothetical protein